MKLSETKNASMYVFLTGMDSRYTISWHSRKVHSQKEIQINAWMLITYQNKDEDYWRGEKTLTSYFHFHTGLSLVMSPGEIRMSVFLRPCAHKVKFSWVQFRKLNTDNLRVTIIQRWTTPLTQLFLPTLLIGLVFIPRFEMSPVCEDCVNSRPYAPI